MLKFFVEEVGTECVNKIKIKKTFKEQGLPSIFDYKLNEIWDKKKNKFIIMVKFKLKLVIL